MKLGRGLASLLVAAVCSARTALALAAPECPASDHPLILLTTDVTPADQSIVAALERHLTAELRAHGIDLCTGAPGERQPIGQVLLRIEHPPNGPVTALIRIGDNVTDKRVERSMNLTRLPPDGRPLAVSAAADELLRASWAELNLVDAPPPRMAPPQELLKALAESTRPSPPQPISHRWQLGLAGNAAGFSRSTTLGGSLGLSFWFHERWGTFLRVGAGFGLPRKAQHGSLIANSQSLAAGVSFALGPIARPMGLAFDAGLSGLKLDFVPTANPGATGKRTADWSMQGSLGARGWFDLGPARVGLGLAALVGLRPSSGTDDGELVVSNEGLGGEATASLSFWL